MTVKLNSSGNRQWLRTYDGEVYGPDAATSVASDSDGNAYVIGTTFSGDVPDIGTHFNAEVVKYGPDGGQLWAKQLPGTERVAGSPWFVAFDSGSETLYTAGHTSGYARIARYTSSGTEQWVRHREGNLVAMAPCPGGVCATGNGPSTEQGGCLTVKWSAEGIEQWARGYPGPSERSYSGIALTSLPSGEIYVTGTSNGTTTEESFTLSYAATGEVLWDKHYYGGFPHIQDRSQAIAVDFAGNCYIAGYTYSNKAADQDFLTIKYGDHVVLAAPSQLTATVASSSSIALTWQDNSSAESGFEIYRRSGEGEFSRLVTVGPGITAYLDADVPLNRTYIYRVRAVSFNSSSAYSNEAACTLIGTPAQLAASATSSTVVELTWTENSQIEVGFEVERKTTTGGASTNSGEFVSIGDAPANATNYRDETAQPSSSYTYRIRALGPLPNSTSAYSNEASVETPTSTQPLEAPSALVATPELPGGIRLSWKDNSTTEVRFEIERWEGSAVFSTIDIAASNAQSYLDADVSSGTTYLYRVRAASHDRVSSYSNEAQATFVNSPGFIIRDAKMISASKFQVVCQTTASGISAIRIDVPFPDGTRSATGKLQGKAKTLTVTFNLKTLRVRLFNQTVRANVSASSLRSDNSVMGVVNHTAVIPIPVVTIHGINPLELPLSKNFSALEEGLVRLSSAQWGSNNAYQRATNKRAAYPTVFAFKWNSNGSTLATGSTELTGWLTKTVFKTTWASRVVLIAHSRGANLARYFLSAQNGAYCAGAILACMPACGSAYISLLSLLPSRAWDDLYPTHPWSRLHAGEEFRSEPDNAILRSLNQRSPPAGVPIVALYGYGPDPDTMALKTSDVPTFSFSEGDGAVTALSAQGMEIFPTAGNPESYQVRTIPWMATVPTRGFTTPSGAGANMIHLNFLSTSLVHSYIFEWLDTHTATSPTSFARRKN